MAIKGKAVGGVSMRLGMLGIASFKDSLVLGIFAGYLITCLFGFHEKLSPHGW